MVLAIWDILEGIKYEIFMSLVIKIYLPFYWYMVGVALGGIILDKLVSCLIITMSFYLHLMDTEKSIKRIIYQRKIWHRKF